MISKIKSRNNDLTQKTNEILSTKDNMNLYERGSNRHRKMQIESSQPLPPYFPHNDTRFENIPRPDSTWSNAVPKYLQKQKGNKLRISLKSMMSSEDKINFWAEKVFKSKKSKQPATIQEKTQDIFRSK